MKIDFSKQEVFTIYSRRATPTHKLSQGQTIIVSNIRIHIRYYDYGKDECNQQVRKIGI